MFLLDVPEDLLKGIVRRCCDAQAAQEASNTGHHDPEREASAHYITELSGNHLHLRAASRLFRTLAPLEDVLFTRLVVDFSAREKFFAVAAAEAIIAVTHGTSQAGIVPCTMQTHSMRCPHSVFFINLHATTDTMGHVPGWRSRCCLHYEIRFRGTDQDLRHVTASGYQGGYPVPESFMTPPAQRDGEQRKEMEAWALFMHQKMLAKWRSSFEEMHRAMARQGCLMFPDKFVALDGRAKGAIQ